MAIFRAPTGRKPGRKNHISHENVISHQNVISTKIIFSTPNHIPHQNSHFPHQVAFSRFSTFWEVQGDPRVAGTQSRGRQLSQRFTAGRAEGSVWKLRSIMNAVPRARHPSSGGTLWGPLENHVLAGCVPTSCPVVKEPTSGVVAELFRGCNDAKMFTIGSVWWGLKNYWTVQVPGPGSGRPGNPEAAKIAIFHTFCEENWNFEIF